MQTVEITADPSATLSVASGATIQHFTYADDMVVWTRRVVPESRLEASPLVFVGHGIVGTEFGWNDDEGVDMRGKTAVILVNIAHPPGDRFDEHWDVSGSLDDLRLRYAVGREVADEARWPEWYPTSEFRAARPASRAAASR
ncbi:MAG TPA: hypothetical protein VMT92_08750 [Steroidobacteraceae bacterium]|nr:hypothetical protein [Steroidobacteraceae bacterium]